MKVPMTLIEPNDFDEECLIEESYKELHSGEDEKFGFLLKED